MNDAAITPIEAAHLYLRQRPGELAELCVGYGNHHLAIVYVLRPSQLRALARDAVNMTLAERLE